MTEVNRISAERAASLLAVLVPGVARVELWPQWSDGDGGAGSRRIRPTPYDAEGRVIDLEPEFRRVMAAMAERIGGVDLDRPQWLSVPSGAVEPVFPVVESLPVALWGSPVAVVPPTVGELLVQRHEVEDPAEPPLGGAQPSQDFARSVADGFVSLPDWGDCDPQPAPARPVADVPVVGEAL